MPHGAEARAANAALLAASGGVRAAGGMARWRTQRASAFERRRRPARHRRPHQAHQFYRQRARRLGHQAPRRKKESRPRTGRQRRRHRPQRRRPRLRRRALRHRRLRICRPDLHLRAAHPGRAFGLRKIHRPVRRRREETENRRPARRIHRRRPAHPRKRRHPHHHLDR